MTVRLDYFQRIVSLNLQSQNLRIAGVVIIDATQIDLGWGWPFRAIMLYPGNDRFGPMDTDAFRYALGAYQASLSGGPGGAFAFGNPKIADTPGADVNVKGSDYGTWVPKLPQQYGLTNADFYTFHCHTFADASGNMPPGLTPPVSPLYESLIVNVDKVMADYDKPGTSGLEIQFAGLGRGSRIRVRVRYYARADSEGAGGFFYAGGADQSQVNWYVDPQFTEEFEMPAQIVNAANQYLPWR